MFFKKLFIIFFTAFFHFNFAYGKSFFSDFSCFQDMKRYYPDLIEGKLEWNEQKRFFRCFRDSLELFVEKKIFTHDPSRDYFTEEEIFRLFHLYFEYDVESAHLLTDRVFKIKKILIGGSVDKLKDAEIASLYRLANDYRDIYFILSKQAVVFKKAFNSEERITSQEKEKVMYQIHKAFVFLEQAYTREKIVYSIEDLYKYGEYFNSIVDFNSSLGPKLAQKSFWFLQNLFSGLFSPQKEIYSEDWSSALSSLYDSLDLFFHYKTHFREQMPSLEWNQRVLEGLEIFVSSLSPDGRPSAKREKGFPIKNLDEILSVFLHSFDKDSPHLKDSLFANIYQKHSVSFLTRALSCLSLEDSQDQTCKSEWKTRGPSVATVSFSDVKFEFLQNEIKKTQVSETPVFLRLDRLSTLKKWLAEYKVDILRIQSGDIKSTAEKRHFDQWLDPFFGWDKQKGSIVFGASHSSKNDEKAHQLLNYQAFLQLFLSFYLPQELSSENQLSISFRSWKKMTSDILPALLVMGGQTQEYKHSWRESFLKLFDLADSFLYSSDRNNFLSQRELVDLTVYLAEALKNAKFAESEILKLCEGNSNPSCAIEGLVKNSEIMSSYPRFKKHLFDIHQLDKYKEKITNVLGKRESESTVQAFHLLPLFVLIQTAELNYDRIDKDKSFNLEADELLSFVKLFEEKLYREVPYLSSNEQARSYLMYSFKSGSIPFFTGNRLTALEFSHWHLNPKARNPFTITPNDFHFLIFDFYNLLSKF